MNIKVTNLGKLSMIGDKVLIKKTDPSDRTKSGLLLPPGVQEKEEIQSGYIIKTGPGYPIPHTEEPESWKQDNQKQKYFPLQVKEGDLAIFLLHQSFEVEFNKQKYHIVPHSAILMVYRDEN